MSVLDKIAGMFRKANIDAPIAMDLGVGVGVGSGTFNEFRPAECIKHYKHWVFVCANLNGNSVAQVPLRLYRATSGKRKTKGKDVPTNRKQYLFNCRHLQKQLNDVDDIEEVVEHPALDLLRDVNPIANWSDLIVLREIFLSLTGTSYWYVESNAGGKPVSLWTLLSQHVKAVASKRHHITQYEYGTGKDKTIYEADEIIRFARPNPFQTIYGFPDIAAVAKQISLFETMLDFEQALLKNGANPSGILLTRPGISNSMVKRAVTKFRSAFGGAQNAGKILSVSGIEKYEPTSIPPKDLQWPEGRQSIKEIICAAMGVPLSLVGVEDVNRANAEAGQYQHALNTIRPKVVSFDETLNQDLIPRYSDSNLFFAHDDPVPHNRELRLEERKTAFATATTINQQNTIDGLPLVEGGDIVLVNRGVTTLGNIISEQDTSVVTPQAPTKVARYRITDATRSNIIQQKARRSENPDPANEKKLKNAVSGTFEGMENEVVASMSKSPSGDIADWLYNPKKWQATMAVASKTPYSEALYNGMRAGLADLPKESGIAIDVQSPNVGKFIKDESKRWTSKVVKTNLSNLEQALRVGIEAGESIQDLKNRVHEAFEVSKNYYAERIARTEVVRAFNGGIIESYKQSGVVTGKEWLTSPDACEFCVPLDGKIIELEKTYFDKGDEPNGNQGGKMTLDYSSVGFPPLHPNCKCTVFAVLREDI